MISAHDWIDNSTIDVAVLKRWPDYRVWLVATDDVDMSELAATADDLYEQAIDSARVLDDADDHVLRWQDAYRTFGVKPRTARSSIDALRRRVGSDNGLPQINVLVDMYNAISILHRVPIGGEDLDRYDGPARLLLARRRLGIVRPRISRQAQTSSQSHRLLPRARLTTTNTTT